MMISRTRLCLIVAVALLAAAPSAHANEVWTAPAYEDHGLLINSESIEWKKGKLWFKLSFINNTGKMMMVDIDQFQVGLADGRRVTREKGVFDKLNHGTVGIKPNAGEKIAVEFMVGDSQKATLALNGITLNDAPTHFADLIARAPAGATVWVAKRFDENGVQVTLQAKSSGDKVDIDLAFFNNRDVPIFVDPEGFTVKLPEGTIIAREKGAAETFIKKKAQVIQPKSPHKLSLTFKVGQPAKFDLVMAGVNANALNLPNLTLTPQGD